MRRQPLACNFTQVQADAQKKNAAAAGTSNTGAGVPAGPKVPAGRGKVGWVGGLPC